MGLLQEKIIVQKPQIIHYPEKILFLFFQGEFIKPEFQVLGRSLELVGIQTGCARSLWLQYQFQQDVFWNVQSNGILFQLKQ